MNLKLIACEILYREFALAVAQSPHKVDIEFLPKGLHDIGQKKMSARLQEVVAAVEVGRYDAILLGYGLCSNGLVGLAARQIPLVLPRAHDCITLFLGDKQRYLDYFQNNPGVYFKTTGWVERGHDLSQLQSSSIQHKSCMTMTYEEMVERYGEDNAKFLYDQLCDMTRNYSKFAYIAMGLGPDARYENEVRELAARQGWKFERLEGSLRLMRQLVDGDWNEADFLVVPPGHRVAASYDDGVIRAEPDISTSSAEATP